VKQEEPDLVAVDVLVQRRDPVRERGQFAEQLHADQPAADYHEGELPALALGVRLDVGALEALDDVVAEQEGVRKILEREGVLRAGDHFPVGHPPQRDDELVVGQLTRLPPGTQADHAALQVDALDRGFDEPRGPQERTEREGAMAGVERPGADLE
jgi:hypothetical protein